MQASTLPRRMLRPLTATQRILVSVTALGALFLAAFSLSVFPPFLAREAGRNDRQRTDILDIRDDVADLQGATYLVVDPEPGLPCSRQLIFDAASFNVTDGGCGENFTVGLNGTGGGGGGSGAGITFGFVSGTGEAGFTTIVAKTGAFFHPEASWKDITDEMAEINGTGQGAFFNASGGAAVVELAGRYLIELHLVQRRGTGDGPRLVLGGIGLDGADPVEFAAATSVTSTIWFASGGARIFDLAADTRVRVYVMQILEGAGFTLLDIDFSAIVCTITAF